MRVHCAATWLLLAPLGCSKPAAQAKQESPAPSESAALVAIPVGIAVTNEVSVTGLRVRSGTIGGAGVWGFSELALDLSRLRLEIVVTKTGAPLPALLPKDGLAIVNGGYFEADFRPSTWLRSGGQDLAPKTDTSKGGLLAVEQRRSYVGAFADLAFEPELAVQSFPLILEAGGKSGIHRDDGRRAARTVVCAAGGALRFVLIAAPRGEGPTLFETAALLRQAAPSGFGCGVALNLDGGPSSGVVFAPSIAAKQRVPLAHVAYGIAILPR